MERAGTAAEDAGGGSLMRFDKRRIVSSFCLSLAFTVCRSASEASRDSNWKEGRTG